MKDTKINRRFGWWLIVAILALSCNACSSSNDAPEIKPEPAREGRTILTFLWANNNLTDYLQTNIGDMMFGLTSLNESACVLVYWDGKSNDPNWNTPAIVSYTADGKGRVNGYDSNQLEQLAKGRSVTDLIALGKVEKVYPDQLSTNPQVMRQVLVDMMQLVPSKSYGLIFGSHGSGWLPSITGTRSIGQDGEWTNHTVLIPELAAVLKTSLQTVGQEKFDFLLFDACMMGSAEVYYELKEVAQHCLASVLDIPAAGLPYETILPDFYAQDLTTALPRVCDAYIREHNGRAWGTISWVDCSKMEALAEATCSLLQTYEANMQHVDLDCLQEYGRERSFNTTFVGIHCDMVQFLKELVGGELPSSFQQTFDATVRYTKYTESVGYGCHYYEIDGDHYCGMGMYIPYYPMSVSKAEFWNNYFETAISWYAAAGWADTKASWAAAN